MKDFLLFVLIAFYLIGGAFVGAVWVLAE